MRTASGTISAGRGEAFTVNLTAGRAHRVFVRPDDPTADFDLHIYDENNNLVTQDIGDSPDAFCVVTPRWSGPFTMVVTAAAGISRYDIAVDD